MQEIQNLAACILHYRRSFHESQAMFAERCGLSVEIVSLLERKLANPSLGLLVKISKHLGISVSAMLSFTEGNEKERDIFA
ncbi:MAG: helix-turn-helix transcriptional regulator [Ruminococcaceae bacterium]|nr:helix-turn-helix transcriptional regulator [Oscillospiraceae bacterium]